ncbi:MAG: right-handed parallel beta-helix repeat-containing protein [Candidatus Hydrogenedentales bacterium]|jgi:hypothetical protein
MRSIIAAVLVGVCGAWGAEFHVSPLGNDSNGGTADAPFATLSRARDAIRALKQGGTLPEGGVTVWLHAGEYRLTESVALAAEDSGEPERPVVYRAIQGEAVRITGGAAIPAEAFGSVTDAAMQERMDPSARTTTLCADLKALGVTTLGEMPDSFVEPPVVPELFFDDARMTLARWPNEDWAHVARVVESGPAPWRNVESDKPGIFEYEGDRPARWKNAPGVWLQGYWCFDWSSETIKTASIDTDKRQITLGKNHVYGIGGGNPAPRRFCALNLLEELDQPGEYYIDRENARLYFWPPKPVAESRVVLSTLTTPMITMKDVSHVTLQGITLETSCQRGIEVSGGRENRIAACTLKNLGFDGISVDGGEKHQIVACDLFDLGTAGVSLSGGDRKTLTPCGHEALNNHIYQVSRRRRTHAFPVHMAGVGVRIAHNLIHDTPHQAIGMGGNEHVIELNEIYNSGLESDDCGAFYMGRNPSERGNVIRHNYWHDTGSAMNHGSCAVYFDDGTGGQKVIGNVFYRAAGGSFGAVFIHGGHDNVVENNVFVECKRAVGHAPWDDKYWNEWLAGDLWHARLLEEVDITKPPYSERYPELQGLMEQGSKMRINRVSRNLIYRCDDVATGNWGLSNNWVTQEDPGFVDAASKNFQLRDGAPVFERIKGFEKIPFDTIGLYVDELRTVLPVD